MAATYTFDPALSRPLDAVRQRLGDDDIAGVISGPPYVVNNPLVADETINAKLASGIGVSETLAQIAEGLVAKFGSLPDEVDQDGTVKVSWKSRAKTWLELVKLFRGNPDFTVPACEIPVGVAVLTHPDTSTYRH